MLIDILKNRFTAKWWSDKQIEDDKINYILDCIYQAPSKNGRYAYEVMVVDDQSIKDWLYWDSTYCIDGVRKKEGPIGNRRYNGQVIAPLLLAWVADNNDVDTYNDCLVSATIAMMAAEEHGLNTGFNGCLDRKETANKLNRVGCTVPILLGIGYVDYMDDKLGREVFKDGIKHGFDYGNIDPSNISGPNRKDKPTKDELITRSLKES